MTLCSGMGSRRGCCCLAAQARLQSCRVVCTAGDDWFLMVLPALMCALYLLLCDAACLNSGCQLRLPTTGCTWYAVLAVHMLFPSSVCSGHAMKVTTCIYLESWSHRDAFSKSLSGLLYADWLRLGVCLVSGVPQRASLCVCSAARCCTDHTLVECMLLTVYWLPARLAVALCMQSLVDLPPEVARVANQAAASGGQVLGELLEPSAAPFSLTLLLLIDIVVQTLFCACLGGGLLVQHCSRYAGVHYLEPTESTGYAVVHHLAGAI